MPVPPVIPIRVLKNRTLVHAIHTAREILHDDDDGGSTTRTLQSRLIKNPVFLLAWRTIREFIQDDGPHMAAGVAYYAILSLFPLIVGLIALLGPVLESDIVKTGLIRFFHSYVPGSTVTVETNIASVGRLRSELGLMSLLGLFWTSFAIFGAISRSMNRAYDSRRKRPFYIEKLRHMGMSIGVGFLFVLSVTATTFLQFLDNINLPFLSRLAFFENAAINAAARLLPFFLSLTIFILVYRLVPNVRTRWTYIWPGALFAAVCFELSKSLFAYYVDNFAKYDLIYGSLGSVVALLIWAYASALILILGAELSSVYGRTREAVMRVHPVEAHHQPKKSL